MKKIVILIFALVVVSCQDNFDEWNDTDQRRITFNVCTDGFYENYLSLSDNGYSKGTPQPLDVNHKIRLSSYCYDANGALVQKLQILMDGLGTKPITFLHLLKNQEYRFEFLVDIIETDNAVDYYESWFQLRTDSISSFYLFCFQPNEEHHYNIMKHATLYATPKNDTLNVTLNSITVNGYCVLSNLQGIERISGYYDYNESFFLNSMLGRKQGLHTYSHLVGEDRHFVIPLTTSTIADNLFVKVKRVMLNKVDSAYVSIKNLDNKPFVVDIDCQTLKMKSCVYY